MIALQTPAPDASQFDFWVGTWECTGRSRVTAGKDEWQDTKGTNTIKKILDGKVVEEDFSIPGFSGKSWTVYDAQNKLWRQTWVDNSGGYLVFRGGVQNGNMTLDQEMGPNSTVRMRMVFKDVKKEAFTWEWERSDDSGKTWELQWRLGYNLKR